MNADELKKRTKAFALRVVRLVESLPRRRTAEVIGRQLLRSGTSVGANYRAACRAKSTALEPLMTEADELLSITVSSIKTAKTRRPRK